MRVVAKRTGLSPHVIRVWERRYGAIAPARSQTNRRLYSEEDIQRLSYLARLTQYGHSISQVATLPDDELAVLVQQLAAPLTPPGPRRLAAGKLNHQDFVHEALGRIKVLDTQGLEAILKEAGIRMSQRDLIDGVLSPLLEQIGALWKGGELRPSHEHMASAIIRSFIGNLPEAFTAADSAPRVVIATLEGQRHELGALMAAKTAAAEGWAVTYLGANLPTQDIAAVVAQADAQLLGLSIIYAEDPAKVINAIASLQDALPPHIPIVAGGKFTQRHKAEIEALGVIVLDNMDAFRDLLNHRNLELTGTHKS